MNRMQKLALNLVRFDLDNHTKSKINYDRELQQQQRCQDRITSITSKLNQFVNRPVIVFSNEISDPVIGFGVSIVNKAENRVLRVHDYITNLEVLVFGKIYHYHPSILEWYYDSDPRFITFLLYNKSKDLTEDIDHQLSLLLNFEEVNIILEANGFFEKLNEYRRNNQ